MTVESVDGSRLILGPGEVFEVRPGQNAGVVGDELCVALDATVRTVEGWLLSGTTMLCGRKTRLLSSTKYQWASFPCVKGLPRLLTTFISLVLAYQFDEELGWF